MCVCGGVVEVVYENSSAHNQVDNQEKLMEGFLRKEENHSMKFCQGKSSVTGLGSGSM